MNAIAAYGLSQSLITLDAVNARSEQLVRQAALARAAREAARNGGAGRPSATRRFGKRVADIVVAVLDGLHPTPTDGLVVDDVMPRLRDYPFAA